MPAVPSLDLTRLPSGPFVDRSTIKPSVVEQFCALVGEPTADPGHGIPASFLTMSTANVFGEAAKATVPQPFLARGVIVRRSIDLTGTIQSGIELAHAAAPSSLSVGPNSVRIEFQIVSTHEGTVVGEQTVVMTVPGVSNPVDIGNQTPSGPDAPWAARETTDIPVDESLTTRYASLTGEDGAMHLSRRAAAQLGFEAPILQASCTLALVAAHGRCVTVSRAATVSGISIRFRAPVIPPGVVTARFSAPEEDVGPTSELRRCRFDATSRGVKVCEGRLVLRKQPTG
jgi:acyl dehydratase